MISSFISFSLHREVTECIYSKEATEALCQQYPTYALASHTSVCALLCTIEIAYTFLHTHCLC